MIQIHQERCIGCSKCSLVCPLKIIEMENRKATVVRGSYCIRCAHCMSVCPAGAIEGPFTDSQLGKEISELSLSTAEAVENLLLTRRSIRAYEKRPVEKEILEKLLRLGAHAPTGSNRQDVKFIVIGSKGCSQLETAAQEYYLTEEESKVKEIIQDGGFQVLLGAPTLIGLYANQSIGKWSCAMAAHNLVLAAHSMGLGTCYNGIFLRAYLGHPAINNYFTLPEEDEMHMFISIGYPKKSISYRHAIERKPAQVQWLE